MIGLHPDLVSKDVPIRENLAMVKTFFLQFIKLRATTRQQILGPQLGTLHQEAVVESSYQIHPRAVQQWTGEAGTLQDDPGNLPWDKSQRTEFYALFELYC